MDILRKSGDYNVIINQNTDFQTNLGWEEGMNIFEEEVLDTIINPADNYETVRYIHEPYTFTTSGDTQCDIWFKFFFIDGNQRYDNGLDYSLIGIAPKENALMTKQSTSSFFRLEFFKTPGIFWSENKIYSVDDIVSYGSNTYKSLSNNNINNVPDRNQSTDWDVLNENETLCEPPTRLNRKFVFARNLSLPIGEKFYYTTLRQNIHVPIFMGSNYKNKENMYLFWFQDETVLSDSILRGNTFFMTAKFYNGVDGSIIDFTNSRLGNTTEVLEPRDLYYKVVINKTNYTYKIYQYDGEQNNRIGHGLSNSINFYEKGGEIGLTPTPTPPAPSPSAPLPTPPATPAVSPSPSAPNNSGEPTYTVSVNSTSINETTPNNELIVTVTTTNVLNNTTLYWGLTTGSNIAINVGSTYSDFTGETFNVLIVNNTGTFTITAVADTRTEGPLAYETFGIDIRTGNTAGPIVATTGLTLRLNDTSQDPQFVTYYDVKNCTTGNSGLVMRYPGPDNLSPIVNGGTTTYNYVTATNSEYSGNIFKILGVNSGTEFTLYYGGEESEPQGGC
jgi:hypothetical protein